MLTAKLATRVDIPRAVTTGLTDQRKWAKMSNQFTHTYRHAGAGGSARRRRPLDGDQRHPGCCCSDLGHLGEWRAGIQDIILGRHYDTPSPWGYFSGRLLSFLSGIKVESVGPPRISGLYFFQNKGSLSPSAYWHYLTIFKRIGIYSVWVSVLSYETQF